MARKLDLKQALEARKSNLEGRASLVEATAKQLLHTEAVHISDAPQLVSTNLIDRSPYQPRVDFNDDELEALAETIRETGRLRQPIEIRQLENGRYELLDGERRWLTATNKLSWDKIDAFVYRMNDQTAMKYACLANFGRVQLTHYETAKAIKTLKEGGFASSNRQVAKMMEIDEKYVRLMLQYFDLPEKILQQLERTPQICSINALPDFQILVERGNLEPLLSAIELHNEGKLEARRIADWASRKSAGQIKKMSQTIPVQSPQGRVLGKLTPSTRTLKIECAADIDPQKLARIVEAAMIENCAEICRDE